MPTQGTWGIGPFRLPDFGITEAFAANRNLPNNSTWVNPNQNPGARPTGAPAVLGTNTQRSFAPAGSGRYQTGSSGGGSGNGGVFDRSQPVQAGGQTFENADAYDRVYNDINSAWDNYLNSLNDTGGYLNDQRSAQEGIVNSQWQQGQDVANRQKASSLRDIANTTKNAFTAGNNYLGSMGAGDSSAANQYSFAINQQAGKQTGDLNNFVSGQMQDLQSKHDQGINSIAQWFAQQQEGLKQQIAQGKLGKGQDLANLSKGILDQAMQATNAMKQNTQSQYNALVQWAASNSQNLGQLQQNIAGIPQAMGAMSMQGGGVGGNNRPMYGGTAPSNGNNTDIWGNQRT